MAERPITRTSTRTTSPIRSSIVLVLVLVLVLGFFWWGGMASFVHCVFFHRNSLLTSNGRKTDNENEHENDFSHSLLNRARPRARARSRFLLVGWDGFLRSLCLLPSQFAFNQQRPKDR